MVFWKAHADALSINQAEKAVAANAAFAMQGYRSHADTYERAGRIGNPARRISGEGISLLDTSGEFAIACARGILAS